MTSDCKAIKWNINAFNHCSKMHWLKGKLSLLKTVSKFNDQLPDLKLCDHVLYQISCNIPEKWKYHIKYTWIIMTMLLGAIISQPTTCNEHDTYEFSKNHHRVKSYNILWYILNCGLVPVVLIQNNQGNRTCTILCILKLPFLAIPGLLQLNECER